MKRCRRNASLFQIGFIFSSQIQIKASWAGRDPRFKAAETRLVDICDKTSVRYISPLPTESDDACELRRTGLRQACYASRKRSERSKVVVQSVPQFSGTLVEFWEFRYQQLVVHVLEHGNDAAPTENRLLQSWVGLQRSLYKEDKLTLDRLESLHNIGFKFDAEEEERAGAAAAGGVTRGVARIESDEGETELDTSQNHEVASSKKRAKKKKSDNDKNSKKSPDEERDVSVKPTHKSWPLVDIPEPGENDCLVGRGRGTIQYPGNIRYRKTVDDQKAKYLDSTRTDKPLMALNIVHAWRAQDPPGRFLKQDPKTKLWEDVGDGMAQKKTSQALRDKWRTSKRGVHLARPN